ncbi:terminase, partial [Klebsiella pneumoniae]|nr:terminase [Klebsiella pneumoniae]
LNGDFGAGMEDDAYQLIPTAWIERAQARWKPLDVKPEMTSIGVDVARGGKDETIISRRHDWWFDELLSFKGVETD